MRQDPVSESATARWQVQSATVAYIEDLTNRQLAEAVFAYVWSRYPVESLQHDLLWEVMDRLRGTRQAG